MLKKEEEAFGDYETKKSVLVDDDDDRCEMEAEKEEEKGRLCSGPVYGSFFPPPPPPSQDKDSTKTVTVRCKVGN